MNERIGLALYWLLGVLVVVALVVCVTPFVLKAIRSSGDGMEHGYGESSSKAHFLLECANVVIQARAQLPENGRVLYEWMRKSRCGECSYEDCFVDGFRTPFRIDIQHESQESVMVIVWSAGRDKQFDLDDRKWQTRVALVK